MQIICGNEPPNWVNRLAAVGSYIPMLEKAIPKEWFVNLGLVNPIMNNHLLNHFYIINCFII